MSANRFSDKSGRVLIIAGSDSSGGAGIQADIKAVTMLGGFAMSAITALTAQNTLGVQDISPVDVPFVVSQIASCLSDIGADVVKTGMLGSVNLVDQIASTLDSMAPGTPRIIDPVMVASSGDRLVDERAVDAIKSVLVAGATLVTPNIPETELITGLTIRTHDDQRRAGEAILDLGAAAALIKGGHMSGTQLIDTLVTGDGVKHFTNDRIETSATHGTGCTLASAIAAKLSLGHLLEDAVAAAHAYLYDAIKQAPKMGGGTGPVRHNWAVT